MSTVPADPALLSIAAASQMIARRQLSPVELVQACLDRIGRHNDRLRAVVTLTAESALEEARGAEREAAAGRALGPLHGIPIGLKDVVDTAGVRTTMNSRLYRDNVPAADAPAWARLKSAGAILLGKLDNHEFCLGGPATDALFPHACNPWDVGRYTGGSSSGSGAAVAAGFVTGAFGTDTGGSIRIPAGFCGIAGIKPTYGLVSRRGVYPLSYTLDHIGPMAWTAEDCAYLLQGMVGHDPGDPTSLRGPVPDYVAGLTDRLDGLKIGLVEQFHRDDARATPDVAAAVEATAEVFRDLGAEVRPIRLPSLADFTTCCVVVMMGEAFAIHERNLQTRWGEYCGFTRQRLGLGGFVSAADYVEGQRLRKALITATEKAMEPVDLIVCAGLLVTSPKLENVRAFQALYSPSVSTPFNVLGTPSLAVCCGFDAGSLPISIQIAGRALDEATVLRAGVAYERATAWRSRRPQLD